MYFNNILSQDLEFYRCVIDVFGGVFVLARCFLDFFPVGVGAFVMGLSQISSFFAYYRIHDNDIMAFHNYMRQKYVCHALLYLKI